MEVKEENYKNDHDLLIALNTKFSFLVRRIETVIQTLSTKADVTRVETIESAVERQDRRLEKLEDIHRDENVRRESFLKIGKWSVGGWQIITGGIITVLTLINLLS